MNPELIKQAYAYGASVALQELGFDTRHAEAGGIKLAEDAMEEEEDGGGGSNPALQAGLGAAIGVPAGTLAGLGIGGALADKKFGKRRHPGDMRGFGHHIHGAGLGALAGGIGGAALGQLGGESEHPLATSVGAGLGAVPGATMGGLAGMLAEARLSPSNISDIRKMSLLRRMAANHSGGVGATLGGLGGGIGGGALANYLANKIQGQGQEAE
jgi:hypothetical protein